MGLGAGSRSSGGTAGGRGVLGGPRSEGGALPGLHPGEGPMVEIPAVIWAKFCPSLVGQPLAGWAPACLRVCLHPWRSTWEVSGAGQAVCCVRCLACG